MHSQFVICEVSLGVCEKKLAYKNFSSDFTKVSGGAAASYQLLIECFGILPNGIPL